MTHLPHRPDKSENSIEERPASEFCLDDARRYTSFRDRR